MKNIKIAQWSIPQDRGEDDIFLSKAHLTIDDGSGFLKTLCNREVPHWSSRKYYTVVASLIDIKEGMWLQSDGSIPPFPDNIFFDLEEAGVCSCCNKRNNGMLEVLIDGLLANHKQEKEAVA